MSLSSSVERILYAKVSRLFLLCLTGNLAASGFGSAGLAVMAAGRLRCGVMAVRMRMGMRVRSFGECRSNRGQEKDDPLPHLLLLCAILAARGSVGAS